MTEERSLAVERALRDVREVLPDASKVTCNYTRGGAAGLRVFGLEVTRSDGSVILGYVRFLGLEREEEVLRETGPRAVTTPAGPGVRALPGGGLLFLFPNDRKLRRLDRVLDLRRLKRDLATAALRTDGEWRMRGRRSSVAIIRYKPERRLVARMDAALIRDDTGERAQAGVILRYFADRRGAGLFEVLSGRTKDPIGEFLPRPIGHAIGGRVYVEEQVPGTELATALNGDAHAPVLLRVLQALRASSPKNMPRISPGATVGRALDALAMLREASPRLASATARLEERILSSIPGDYKPVLVHGDLHLHQLLASSTGDRHWLVDFERAGAGHPAQDAASLCAHLDALAQRSPEQAGTAEVLMDAILEDVGRHGHLEAMAFHRLCALVDQALLPLRRQDADWESVSTGLLEAALARFDASPAPGRFSKERLAEQPRWSVFRPRARGPWPGEVEVRGGTTSPAIYTSEDDRIEPISPEEDPCLPGLRGRWGSARLVTYRPHRRAVFRADDDGDVSFVKIVEPSRVSRVVRGLRAAASAAESASILTPTVLDVDAEQGAVRMSDVPGASLNDVLASPEPGPTLERVGEALAEWHDLRPDPELPISSGWSLDTWLVFVARHDPSLAVTARDVLRSIPPLPSDAREVLVHGDLHDRNVVVGPQHVGLLDVDGVCRGVAALDVGNLTAHLHLRGLQRALPSATREGWVDRFLGAYGAGGGDLDRQAVNVIVARTLVRLAILYRFRRRWLELSPVLLREASRWVE